MSRAGGHKYAFDKRPPPKEGTTYRKAYDLCVSGRLLNKESLNISGHKANPLRQHLNIYHGFEFTRESPGNWRATHQWGIPIAPQN